MSKDLLIIFSIIGAIALFLYGMKQMSSALLKMTGNRLRNIMTKVTSNPFRSVLTGFSFTGIIQSSSASTVMIVSFVNAGIVSFRQAMGLIFGANIGTTLTLWLVSFSISLDIISWVKLPLIALVFPLIFSKKTKYSNLGEFLIGFSLILISIDFIKLYVADGFRPQIQEFILKFTDFKHLSAIIFVLIGFVITIIFQSSSATTAVTITLISAGVINLELGAAMILGENMGTTLTANFAAIVANRPAKRAALSHFLINFIGTLWILFLIPVLIPIIEKLCLSLSLEVDYFAMAVFHSLFNIANMLILIWFIPSFEKLTLLLLPPRKGFIDSFNLKHIKTGLLSTSEISLVQAQQKSILYGKHVIKMFKLVNNLFYETNNDSFEQHYKEIQIMEEESDKLNFDISLYLHNVSKDDISNDSIDKIKKLERIIDNTERIGHVCFKLSKTIRRKKKNNIWFTQEFRNYLKTMFGYVADALELMQKNLSSYPKEVNIEKARKLEKTINRYRKKLRQQQMSNKNDDSTYQAELVYNEVYARCEQIGDFALNISEILHEKHVSIH